jgi:tetratricopeptide (TPR) repeat protein
MLRCTVLCLAALSLRAFAEDAAPPPPEAPRPKLTVLPFAALSGDVPPRAGAKAQGMLTTEFKSADTFTLLDAKKTQSVDSASDALAQARAAVEEARQLRTRKKFRLADEALQKALAAYRSAGAALPEIGELVDTWALAAAVAYNTGRDDEGARYLTQALALAPERDLPLALGSPLFSRVVADARKALKGGPRGTLVLDSAPSNAPLQLDGLPLGSTPLTVTDVPPGLHVWSVRLPSGETVAGVIEVQAGKSAQVKAQSSSKDPESRLLTVLSQNKLDAEALAAAKDQAKAADADFVVFGALSKDGKGLSLESFLYATSTGELRRLARAQFDTELLSAGMEFYSLAGELAKKGDQVGEAVKLPASVSLNPIASGPRLAEAKYGVVPGAEVGEGAEPGEAKDDSQRKPAEVKRRVPLKKQ